MKENKKISIQISYGMDVVYDKQNDEHPNIFNSETDAIKYLKNVLIKRTNVLEENVLAFTSNCGIKIFFNYSNCGTVRIFANELDAIEYLKSLYIKRLEIDSNGI